LPVILATGFAELSGGAVPPYLRRLAKPFRVPELADMVAGVIASGREA
jgi:hypothetical protein